MTRRRCFAIMRSTVYELCVNAQPAKENPMLWFKNLMIYRLNRDIRCPQTTGKTTRCVFLFPVWQSGYGENRLGFADGFAQ